MTEVKEQSDAIPHGGNRRPKTEELWMSEYGGRHAGTKSPGNHLHVKKSPIKLY
jgi:hypothetical protein